MQVGGKAAGCNSYGHLFLKSIFVNPEHSKEEGNIVKADQAFWYVLLLVYKQSFTSICKFSREKYWFVSLFGDIQHTVVLHPTFNPIAQFLF